MRPKRDSPGYRTFVQALADAADLVEVRVGSAGFLEHRVDEQGALHVTYRKAGDVISLPRVGAVRVADAGMGEVVDPSR